MNRVQISFNQRLQAIKRILSYAAPISASMVLNKLATFIAVLMLARLGKQQLAAVALASPTFATVILMSIALFYAVSILVSFEIGQASDSKIIGKIFKNSIVLSILLSTPMAILLWNADILLFWLKQNPQLIAMSQPFFHFAALSLLPSSLTSVCAQFHSGIGKPKFSLLITLLSLPFLVVTSYAFIFGQFGMPPLGLASITCSIFLVNSIRIILILIYMVRSHELRKYQLFSGSWRFDLSLWRKIIKLGLPIGLQFSGELAAMTVSAYLMGYFGKVALAASQIVAQYSILILMVLLGLSQSGAILVSKSYGAKDYQQMTNYFYAGFIILIGLALLVASCFLLLPRFLIHFYINVHDPINADLVHFCIIFFIISAVIMSCDSIRHYASGVLRGLQDSKTPMYIGLGSLWFVSLPMSYLVAFGFDGGPIGLRIGFVSGYFLCAIWLVCRCKTFLSSKSLESKN